MQIIKNTHEELWKANQAMTVHIGVLIKENTKLSQENTKLNDRFVELWEYLDAKEVALNAYSNEIKILKEENEELKREVKEYEGYLTTAIEWRDQLNFFAPEYFVPEEPLFGKPFDVKPAII